MKSHNITFSIVYETRQSQSYAQIDEKETDTASLNGRHVKARRAHAVDDIAAAVFGIDSLPQWGRLWCQQIRVEGQN